MLQLRLSMIRTHGSWSSDGSREDMSMGIHMFLTIIRKRLQLIDWPCWTSSSQATLQQTIHHITKQLCAPNKEISKSGTNSWTFFRV